MMFKSRSISMTVLVIRMDEGEKACSLLTKGSLSNREFPLYMLHFWTATNQYIEKGEEMVTCFLITSWSLL